MRALQGRETGDSMTDYKGIPRLLTLGEVAELLRKTPAQMRWMRHKNEGPRSAKLGGRVMYREQDVYDWIQRAFEGDEPNDARE